MKAANLVSEESYELARQEEENGVDRGPGQYGCIIGVQINIEKVIYFPCV
jgi:hypothetical protein